MKPFVAPSNRNHWGLGAQEWELLCASDPLRAADSKFSWLSCCSLWRSDPSLSKVGTFSCAYPSQSYPTMTDNAIRWTRIQKKLSKPALVASISVSFHHQTMAASLLQFMFSDANPPVRNPSRAVYFYGVLSDLLNRWFNLFCTLQ